MKYNHIISERVKDNSTIEFDKNILNFNIHSRQLNNSHRNIKEESAQYEIYTDGPKYDNQVRCAFVVYLNQEEIDCHTYRF